MKDLEIGVQYHPRHEGVPVHELQRLTSICADHRVDQVWLGDNLGRRHLLVSLAALAPLGVKVGAAVLVQYFRSPWDAAAGIATITDLTDERELSVGLGRGNPGTSGTVAMPRAITFMREYASALRALWAGDDVTFADYPVVADHFHLLEQGSVRLGFRPQGPLKIYGGGSGRLGVKAAYDLMDGLIYNGTTFLPDLRLGRAQDVLTGDGRAKPAGFRRIAEVKISVHDDPAVARRFAAPSVAIRVRSLRIAGFDESDYGKLGITWDQVALIEHAISRGASEDELGTLVSDAMLDALFICGTPAQCIEKLGPVVDGVRAHGFDQLLFSEIGPELSEAVPCFVKHVLPEL